MSSPSILPAMFDGWEREFQRRRQTMTLKLIVGLGSPHGDDQAGWRIAERLATAGLAARVAATPADLLDWIDGCDELHVVDACAGGGAPGELRRWVWPDLPAEAGWRSASSHLFSGPAALGLAERLGRLPRRVVVWGVVGEGFAPASNLSSTLQSRLPELAAAIAEESGNA